MKKTSCPYCQLIVNRNTAVTLDAAPVTLAIKDALPGQVWNVHYPGFEFKGEIGRGGMGSVLLVRELSAKRDVALKTFSPFSKKEATLKLQERFLEEALITAQLQHPGIVPIYAIARDSAGRYFYTMRPIEGESLKQIVNKLKMNDPIITQKYSLKLLIQIIYSVCQTMRFAHERGVIHRDLKPANIIVGNYGEVQVIDWGLAKVIGKAVQAKRDQEHDENNSYSAVWASYQRDIETDRSDSASDFQ